MGPVIVYPSQMDRTDALTLAAERLFDQNGYTATGMDRLTQAAGMSSRTHSPSF